MAFDYYWLYAFVRLESEQNSSHLRLIATGVVGKLVTIEVSAPSGRDVLVLSFSAYDPSRTSASISCCSSEAGFLSIKMLV
jgi:hypothetical protein